MEIGTLERIRIREVWPGEESDFTPWLCQNIELVNDAIGLNLDPDELQRETPVGKYRLDILGSSGDDRVIIENQYGATDHKHLGQVVTYAAILEAKIAVWICEQPEPEHIQALSFLNESGSTQFWLLKIEALSIDNSSPAPLLTVITKPSEDLRAAGDAKRQLASEGRQYAGYWARLLEIGSRVQGFSWNNTGAKDSWISKVAVSGEAIFFSMAAKVKERHLRFVVERRGEEDWNQSVVDTVYDVVKDDLQSEFPGFRHERTRRAGVNTAKIVVYLPGPGLDEDGHAIEERARDHAEQMVRFERIITPHLKSAIDAANAAEAAAIAKAEAEETVEQRDALEPLPTP